MLEVLKETDAPTVSFLVVREWSITETLCGTVLDASIGQTCKINEFKIMMTHRNGNFGH